jgi:alpha-ketoglutarate-dependent 2,4-dichlorophenoxyacetate dioxygenase
MGATVHSIRAHFVGEVRDISIAEPLSDADLGVLRQALDEFGVLVFHGQNITDAQQAEFSKRFGALEMPGSASNITKSTDRRLSGEIADLSNLDKNGELLPPDDRQRMFNLGNRLWHSDSSFRIVPAQYSMLSGRIVPATGGDTQFADMYAAYDALAPAVKAELDDLVCEHSLIYSRSTLGFDGLSAAELKQFTPVKQRLVRTHPSTGKRSLYLSSHAGGIIGWPVPEARALLRDLLEDATHERHVYAHEWAQHDFVIWDNQRTMHRARPFADKTVVRDMHRTTVAGLEPTVAQ